MTWKICNSVHGSLSWHVWMLGTAGVQMITFLDIALNFDKTV